MNVYAAIVFFKLFWLKTFSLVIVHFLPSYFEPKNVMIPFLTKIKPLIAILLYNLAEDL